MILLVWKGDFLISNVISHLAALHKLWNPAIRMGEHGVSLDNMEKMEKHFPHDLKYSDSKLFT